MEANFIPLKKAKNREGYFSFIGLIWYLIKINKQCKQSGCAIEIIFKLPVRWL